MPEALGGYVACADIVYHPAPPRSKMLKRIEEDYWICIDVFEIFWEVKALGCGCEINCEVVLQSGFGAFQCKVSESLTAV